MASGHETIFSDDSSPSWTSGISCKFHDPNCVMKTVEDVILATNIDSEPQFPQHHGNEPTESRDLHSSSHQLLGTESSLLHNHPLQQERVSNVPESSHALYHQSSENSLSVVVQEAEPIPDQRPEIHVGGNEDAGPHIPSGTELSASRNMHSFRQGLHVQQPSDIDGSHQPTLKSSGIDSNPKQLVPERHDLLENRCKTTKEMHAQTELDVNQCSATQGSYPSPQQFAESYMNQNKGFNSSTHQQFGNETIVSRDSYPSTKQVANQGYSFPTQQESGGEPIASEGSYPFSHQPHESIANIGQTVLSVLHEIFQNELNPIQGYNLPSQQQSGSEPTASQSSCPFSPQPHGSMTGIGQTVLSVSREIFENELQASRTTNTPRSFHNIGASSSIQDLSLLSFQQSGCKSKDTQSSCPQGLQQSERNPDFKRITRSSARLASGIGPPTTVILNQSIENQDLHSLPRQPAESKTCEIYHLPQAFAENNPNKRQLLHSHFQQHFKRGSRTIPHTAVSQPHTSYASNQPSTSYASNQPSTSYASNQPSTSYASNQPSTSYASNQPSTSYASYQPSTSYASDPLLRNSPETDGFGNKKQSKSKQKTNSDIWVDCVSLSMLQHPYSNRFEIINILVFGPMDLTHRLLQTYAGGFLLKFVSPCSLLFKRNVARCGIRMELSVWQIDDLTGSKIFLRSTCASSNSTIILVSNSVTWKNLDMTLDPQINFIRHKVSRSVSVIQVVGKTGKRIPEDQLDVASRQNSLDFRRMGFRMKARYSLAAFFDCFVESVEEVNAVMFTAMDVSFLSNR